MARQKFSDEWWTAPSEADNRQLIIVTGRRNMLAEVDTATYRYRVEITWQYAHSGMPDDDDARLMEQATDALLDELRRDPASVCTGIFTGDGQRNWIIYTRSLHIFQRQLNRALDNLPDMPLEFYADEDPDWLAYREMSQIEVPEEGSD